MHTHILILGQDLTSVGILQFILRDAGYTVTTADNGAEATGRLLDTPPDLVLLDLAMTPVHGLQLLAHWRAAGFHGSCIAMSAHTDREEELRAFALGVDDYISKPFEPRILLARVHNVARRLATSRVAVSGSSITVGDARLSLSNQTFIGETGSTVALTPIELKLLAALMQQPGEPVSRATLLQQIWGQQWHDQSRLDVYVRRLRLKIEPDPLQPRYLQTVRTIGYVFVGSNDQHEPIMRETRNG